MNPTEPPGNALVPAKLSDTATLRRVTVPPTAVADPYAAALLGGILLPDEVPMLVAVPHPIVLATPLILLAIVALALGSLFGLHVPVIEHGHRVRVPLLGGTVRVFALAIGAVVIARILFSLVRAAAYVVGFRVASTNRRVFVIDGVLRRRIAPLATSELTTASLRRGPLGRLLHYGTILLPRALNAAPALRDLRDPQQLYRQIQAVAYGVEDGRWTPPIRTTIVP